MKVLLVEDDLTDLKLLRSVFAAEGHEVRVARRAEEALRILALDEPDLMVTDLALPDMDGVALAQRLKATPQTAAIPVIALTAYKDQYPTRRTQREAGFVVLLHKPLDADTVQALLAAAAVHGRKSSP